MMRTANPALNKNTFRDLSRTADSVMTIQGTANKTAILLAILVVAAAYTWKQTMSNEGASMMTFVGIGAIGGFVVGLITVFKKTWAPITSPIYAALEGLFLGAISAIYEVQFNGIAFQAVLLTFGTTFALLTAYKTRIIKPTENFKLGIAAATGGIVLIYVVGFVMSFFGSRIPYIHESGPIGIGFSLVVVVVAALNLVLDFDFIENGSEQGAPKYMEWYGAFGLLVTLVWLYLEMLRLLSKIRSR